MPESLRSPSSTFGGQKHQKWSIVEGKYTQQNAKVIKKLHFVNKCTADVSCP
jgi:hypothetical protein